MLERNKKADAILFRSISGQCPERVEDVQKSQDELAALS